MRGLALGGLLVATLAQAQGITPYPCVECALVGSGARVGSGGMVTDGGLFAPVVTTRHLDAGTASVNALKAGTVDAGSIYSTFSQSVAIDAGSLRAVNASIDLLAVGVLDAGTTYTGYLEADTAAIDALFAGIMDAGSVYTQYAQAAVVDAGSVYVQFAQASLVDAGSVYAFAMRTPSIGNRDGGFLRVEALGIAPVPAPAVPLCDGVTTPFGSLIYYNFQWWECSAALASLGQAGSWSYMAQPPIDYEARTPADPQGSSTAAGISFAARNSGTHYLKLAEMAVKVEFAGACTGGCVAGTNARYLIVQRNKQDGGYRELAYQQIPCIAPVGFCSMFSAPPSTGCVSDGGAPLLAMPVIEGGLVELEIQADGGQCTPPPIVSVTGFGFLLMQADGGGS